MVLAVGTLAFRLAGPALSSRVELSAEVGRLMSTAAVVLLTALVAVTALTQGHGFAGVARPAGVGVAALLAWRRAPFVLVVLGAAATAAGLRLLGLP
nr:AzlD domain-containing protein [Microlunatus panaciterrae]